MELRYSETGIPFIELDDKNKLIFSTTTATEKGFKWLIFSGTSTVTQAISAGKGKTKKKKIVKSDEPLRLMMDMSFAISKTKTTNLYLTKKYLNGIKRICEPYVVNGIFLYKNIEKLEKELNTIDDVMDRNDILEEDPIGYYEDDGDDEE